MESRRTHAPLTVDGDAIAQVLSRWTGIPVTALTQDEASRLLHLEGALHRRVIGQKTAVHSIASAIRRSRAGLQEENRPVGSLPLRRPLRRGQDRAVPESGAVPVRQRRCPAAAGYVRVYEAQSVSRLTARPLATWATRKAVG